MSLQDAEDLTTKGHELWKAGRIGEAFACQHASLAIKRRIEHEWDYEVALTSDGLRVQQERNNVKYTKMYSDYITQYIKEEQMKLKDYTYKWERDYCRLMYLRSESTEEVYMKEQAAFIKRIAKLDEENNNLKDIAYGRNLNRAPANNSKGES